MRWPIKEKKEKPLLQWHDWYAWYPVIASDEDGDNKQWVWLETVSRKITFIDAPFSYLYFDKEYMYF